MYVLHSLTRLLHTMFNYSVTVTMYLADTTEIEFRKVTAHSRHSHGCTVDDQGHQLRYHIATGELKENTAAHTGLFLRY